MTIELAKAKQILVSKIGDMLVDDDLQSFLSDVLSALSLKLEDAPSDGKQYSREDGSWSEVVIPTPDVTEAPVDGKQYVRQDANWEEVSIPSQGVEEAPSDGKTYGRKDADWVEVTSGGGEGGSFKLPLWHFYESSLQADVAAVDARYLVNDLLFSSTYKYSRDGYFWGDTTGNITSSGYAPIKMFYHPNIDAYSTHYDNSSGFAVLKNPFNPDSDKNWTVSGGSTANRTVHPVMNGDGDLFHLLQGGVSSQPLTDNGANISIGSLSSVFMFPNASYYPRGAGYCPVTDKIMFSAGLGSQFDTFDSSFSTNQDPGKLYISDSSFTTVTEVTIPSELEQVSSVGYSDYYKCFYFFGVVQTTAFGLASFNIYKMDVSGQTPVFTKVVSDWLGSTGMIQVFNFNFIENVVSIGRLFSYDGENFQYTEGAWVKPREANTPNGYYFKPADSARLSNRNSRQLFNLGYINDV